MDPLFQNIAEMNVRLAELLRNAQSALCGQAVFDVRDVRRLSALLQQMAPVTVHFAELRRRHPESAPQLDLYKSQLAELQATLPRVHVMLHTQRAQMEASRTQLAAVNQWACAVLQTYGHPL